MKLRDLLLIMLASVVLFGVFILYRTSDDRSEFAFNPIEIPEIGEFVFGTAIYGSNNQSLGLPIDLAVNSDGSIYVTDSTNNQIQVFDKNGESLFRFGKFGSEEGQFNYPVGIVTDSKQNVYVVDLLNQRISVHDKEGKFLKALIGTVIAPTAIAIDEKDQLYVVDKLDNKVKILTANGKLVREFGGFGSKEGQFKYPLGLSVSPDGEVVVGDTGNGRVQIFDKKGKFKIAYEANSSGIAVDETNRIFSTDPMQGKVLITTFWGEQEATIGGIGVNEDKLYFPEGIELKDNSLYIADKGNNRIVIYKIIKR